VPDDELSRLRAADLLSLEYHWGSAYTISVVDGRWQAVSRDDGRVLTAPDAPALRDAIRRDYRGGSHAGCSL